MKVRIALTLALCCGLSAQGRDEPWLKLLPPAPPKKEEIPQPPAVWKCETGAWKFDASDDAYQLDGPASAGPYDKDGYPTNRPDGHGTFRATAYARPGSTLVNGQCFIAATEDDDFRFPVGVAIVGSRPAEHNGNGGWTCSALLPYYPNEKRKLSIAVPGLDHVPHMTINAAVSYCYVAASEPSSPAGDGNK